MTTRAVRVALDLLGGDGAPDVVVDGALATGRLQVAPAYESVDMAEDPMRAVRAKRDATVRVATRLIRDGRVTEAMAGLSPADAPVRVWPELRRSRAGAGCRREREVQ